MSEPRGVSVIVVNYNNERFLAAAIDSALGQNHPLWANFVFRHFKRSLIADS